MKILIIEDNPIFSQNFERILRQEFEVDTAETADEAISKIDNNLPDVIILDILLGSHSAFALLNEIQSYSDTSKIPVVICSNLAEELEFSALKSYGVVEILDKAKMRPSDILKIVRKI